jgi:hypothetical protein
MVSETKNKLTEFPTLWTKSVEDVQVNEIFPKAMSNWCYFWNCIYFKENIYHDENNSTHYLVRLFKRLSCIIFVHKLKNN